MPRIESGEMIRVQIYLYKEDLDRINAYYGDTTGLSRTVRVIVRQFLDRMEAKVREKEEQNHE